MDQSTLKPEVTNQPPPDWLTLPSAELGIARRAHLCRLAGQWGKARQLDREIVSRGSDANKVYAEHSNVMNLAEGCRDTAGFSANYRAAKKAVLEPGGNHYDGQLQIQINKRDMDRSAESTRRKFRIV